MFSCHTYCYDTGPKLHVCSLAKSIKHTAYIFTSHLFLPQLFSRRQVTRIKISLKTHAGYDHHHKFHLNTDTTTIYIVDDLPSQINPLLFFKLCENTGQK